MHRTHSTASLGRYRFYSQVDGWKVVRWVHGWMDAGDERMDGQMVTAPELCSDTKRTQGMRDRK